MISYCFFFQTLQVNLLAVRPLMFLKMFHYAFVIHICFLIFVILEQFRKYNILQALFLQYFLRLSIYNQKKPKVINYSLCPKMRHYFLFWSVHKKISYFFTW